jgi:hypothetical protein
VSLVRYCVFGTILLRLRLLRIDLRNGEGFGEKTWMMLEIGLDANSIKPGLEMVRWD